VREWSRVAEAVKLHYNDYYDLANKRKDAILNTIQSDSNSTFGELQSRYYNKSLEEFVTNKNESKKVVVFKGEVVQKLDPIFMDTKYKFIKAQFYAPRKQIFGYSVETYVVNVIVMWAMALLLYFILYFRLLKKLLDTGERVLAKRRKRMNRNPE